MTDVALVFDPATLTADLAIENGDLKLERGLDTAVLISLFTDRRATPDDPLDPHSLTAARGWAGDLLAEDGDRIGSRLWLLERAKMVEDGQPTAELVEQYAAEALQWLLDDGVASTVECPATVVPASARIGASETIQLDPTVTKGGNVLARWGFAWKAQMEKEG